MSNIFVIYKRFFSPFWQFFYLIFPVACKFHPTCSEYSREAIEKYGLKKGFLLSIKRIVRCNPFSKGGIDLG